MLATSAFAELTNCSPAKKESVIDIGMVKQVPDELSKDMYAWFTTILKNRTVSNT